MRPHLVLFLLAAATLAACGRRESPTGPTEHGPDGHRESVSRPTR